VNATIFQSPLKYGIWGGALSCLIFGQFSTCYAREDLVPGSPYTSAQGAAMGDAVLPLGQDGPSALFYNPADLTRIRNTTFEPVNFTFYGNSGWAGSLSPGSFYKITSLSGNQGNLQNHPDTFMGSGAQYVASFYSRGFAVGLLLVDQTGGQANSTGSVSYRSLYQLIPTAGYGMKFAGGVVRIGYSLQWINQASGDNTVPGGTTPLGYNQQLAQGSAFSSNAGFALTIPYTYLPSLNIVVRNIGGAHFNTSSIYQFTPTSTGAPPTDPMTIDTSFSFVTKLGGGENVNWVAEYRDATDQSGMAAIGRAAAGVEYSNQERFFLRAGWGSGYPAAGLAYRQKTAEISLTWYSEELGLSYHAQRDQRYLLGFTVRAF
jgi:hypothetical protein